MKITIIGGSGFVGTRLTKRLLAAGHSVVIADKRRSVFYPELWVRCDVRNGAAETNEFAESLTDSICAPGKAAEAAAAMAMKSLVEVVEGSDVVVNLAAEHRDDVTPHSLYDEVNVLGSQHVCEACQAAGVARQVFTSSVAVYGFAPRGTDESGAINYFNHYGRTKFLAEGKYREWQQANAQHSLVIIRPTVIFGEQNRGNVYNLFRQIASGRFPMVGKGKNVKSMNYVENVAAFIEHCLDMPAGEHLFNYCDTPAYNMNDLVLTVNAALGKPKTRIFHWPYWMGYLGGLCFDLAAKLLNKKFTISSIRVKKFCQDTYFGSSRVASTGFVAPVSLGEGIRRTIDYEFVKKVEGHTFVCE